MAIATYADLQTTVALWLHRTDLTAQVVDFITLAESEINTDMRMRLMESDEPLTLAAGATTIALPARYLEPIQLDIVIAAQDNRELRYQTPKQMQVLATTGSAAEPDFWTINGANIEFPSPADKAYALLFRMLKGFDIATTSTNELLTKYPGIYLYGTLLQAAPYIVNDARIAVWQGMFDRLKAKAIKSEARTRILTTMQSDLPSRATRSNIYQG